MCLDRQLMIKEAVTFMVNQVKPVQRSGYNDNTNHNDNENENDNHNNDINNDCL